MENILRLGRRQRRRVEFEQHAARLSNTRCGTGGMLLSTAVAVGLGLHVLVVERGFTSFGPGGF